MLYSNRSVSLLLSGRHQAALADAEQAVELRPDWDKAHFRRGSALEALGELDKALSAYQQAQELNPQSQEIRAKLQLLKNRVKSQHKEHSSGWQTSASGIRTRITKVPEGGPRMPGPSAWSQGLSPAKQAEWLVDCYRMRVDDDYAYGGCNLHGLYDPDATKDTIAEDFLIFCKLAVQHQVVPAGWDWTRFLKTAAGLLPYAFEKSDASDKWGGENVFSAALGGRSLRFTGEVVYGVSCMAGCSAGDNADREKDYEELQERIPGKWRQLVQSGEVFGDVGGVAAWQQLHGKLKVSRMF